MVDRPGSDNVYKRDPACSPTGLTAVGEFGPASEYRLADKVYSVSLDAVRACGPVAVLVENWAFLAHTSRLPVDTDGL